MANRFATWGLIGLLSVFHSGCAVLDGASYGFAVLSGKRIVDLSGEAPWAQPSQSVEAINLRTGQVLARGGFDASKRYSLQVAVPPEEDLAIVLHAPHSAALLLAPRGEKRQEARVLNLTRGSTTIAWALGAAVANIPVPANGTWSASSDAWKALPAHLPGSHGAVLTAAASALDTVGVGSPLSAATELAKALGKSLETVRAAAGGHPRSTAIWPSLVLGWSDAIHQLPPSTGDFLASQAAASLDVATAVERIWIQAPYTEGQGGLEIRVPLREPGTQRVPEALPAKVSRMRYAVTASMLPSAREGELSRPAIRFDAGSVVLRVPDMPLGYASAQLEFFDETGASLGKTEIQGLVGVAVVNQLKTPAVDVSLANTPSTTPAAHE
ncbi:hypothetical protein D3C86_656860 [compost metagenome]